MASFLYKKHPIAMSKVPKTGYLSSIWADRTIKRCKAVSEQADE